MILATVPGCSFFRIPPPPIIENAVNFLGSGNTPLAGTLTLPAAPGPAPAVLLIGGAAERDRDQVLAGFPTFAVLAHSLVQAGIASLRVDDRGTGGSGGSAREATQEDLDGDARSALDTLLAEPRVDSKRIMVLAHGEGTLVGSKIAARDTRVHGLILLAGLCVPVRDAWLATYRSELEWRGCSESRIRVGLVHLDAFLHKVIEGQDPADESRQLAELLHEDQEERLATQPGASGSDEWIKGAFETRIATAATSPSFRRHASADPTADLSACHGPILALFGGLDGTVDAALNQAALERCRSGTEKPENLEITVFENATHTLQEGVTGHPSEYAELTPEYADGVIERILVWIRKPHQPSSG